MLLALPFLIIIAAFQGRSDQVPGLFLWTITSFSIGQAATLLGPIGAGFAAWIAGTTREQGTRELLDSFHNRARSLHASFAFAAIFWIAVAWLIYVAYLITVGLIIGDWGSLEIMPVAAGASVILATCSLGYALGLAFPSKLAPPIISLSMLIVFVLLYMLGNDSPQLAWMGSFVPQLADGQGSAIKYLSPMMLFTGSVATPLETSWGTIDPRFIGMMAGIALLGLGITVTILRRRRFGAPTLALGLAICVIFMSSLLSLPVNTGELPSEQIEYTNLCEGAPITVCVHPAYKANLDETVEIANTTLGPVAGLPSVPTEITQFKAGEGGDRVFQIYFEDNPKDQIVMNYVGFMLDQTQGRRSPGQSVIGYWLFTRAIDDADGYYLGLWLPERQYFPEEMQGPPTDYLAEKVNAWEQLDTVEQRAWLESHWNALLAGKIGWNDLP